MFDRVLCVLFSFFNDAHNRERFMPPLLEQVKYTFICSSALWPPGGGVGCFVVGWPFK